MAAKLMILLGIALLAAGLILYFAPGAFGWFGKLPGDINIERGNTRIFFPLTSMIVVSLILTLVLNLLFRR
ncbi:MAG TPA: DUF2905 domain-containing protein [Gammaproteobacteria bacterium]